MEDSSGCRMSMVLKVFFLFQEELKEKELEDPEFIYQALVIKELKFNDELQDARTECIKGFDRQASEANLCQEDWRAEWQSI